MLNYQLGNNIESVKTKRVNVNIDLQANNTNARWYFPEIPELNDVQIVGIEAHTTGFSFDLNPDVRSDLSNFWTFAKGTSMIYYCFLNLVNTQNELVIQNFPCITFPNRIAPKFNGLLSNSNKSGRIIPIYQKLNLRQCFIYANPQATPNQNTVATFTFYHLGKK
jgi:hypothetical protein